jgi:spermidine synthase
VAFPAALPRAWRTGTAWATLERRVKAQVFLAGAGIMVLEMLAGRLLAPRFGSTVFTWGSLIGVVMTALALGYWLGGKLGDRRPHAGTLALLLFGAGAFALLLPLFAPPVLAMVAAALPDPRTGPLVASLLLIGPPSLVLGAATPVAVRLAAMGRESAGSTAGNMAGLSTAGSILGTFGTVFVLIPAFDVGTILLGTGALLGAAAFAGPVPQRNALALGMVALLVLTPVGQGALVRTLGTLQTGITDEVLHHESTPYHELYVTQDRLGTTRTLLLDGNRHSAMLLDDPPETPFKYIESFHLGPLLNPNATRVLLIGGGGFSTPKQFLQTYPNVTIDVVEVDPAVVRVAKEWFEVPDDPRLRTHAMDGRQFLARSTETWDLIFLDAYGRTYVPFHLLTLEFLALVREHLAPGGLVVSNVIGSFEGDTSVLLRSEARTVMAAYPWVQVAPVRPGIPAFGVQNVMLLAAMGPPPGWEGRVERAAAWEVEKARPYTATVATIGAGGALRTNDVGLLTDAHAPVEALISPLTLGPYDPEAGAYP